MKEKLTGIFHNEFKKHWVTKFIRNGYILMKYKYLKVNIPFTSPMVRWENLNHCGGWSMCDENGVELSTQINLLQDVINGLKPMGFCYSFGEKQKDEFMKLIIESRLPYTIDELDWKNPDFPIRYGFNICQHGKIGDLLDIDAVIESYNLLDSSHDKWIYNLIKDNLLKIIDNELSNYLTDWNYGNPRTVIESVIVGLLLGYPIEFTYALMTS